MTQYMDEYEQPARRRRHPIRNLLITVLVLILVAALVAGGYLWSLARSFDNGTTTIENALPADSPAKDPGAGNSQNILLIGTDEQDPGSEASRSDTMMLVHLPGDRSTAYVMSIMRDTWTEIPGYGEGKINSAMALGGVPLTVSAVQAMVDAPIDHVAIVDFEGFSGLTDALGGVEVNNPTAFSSSIDDDHFPAGVISLDGDSALNFVRERQSFAEGDYQRVRNQQLFISGLISSVFSKETLLNPGKVSAAVSEISPYLSVDEELDAVAAGRLAFSLRNVRGGNLSMFTLPTLGAGTSSDGQSIVVKDETAIAAIAEAMDNDAMAEYLAANNGGI
ncbi:LCP family protein [Arthrobacter sp. zg-Y820]|uniref:LCP family protein n=1 Tax=unclassified Arthrobacter TaxID=235627 RepID=UPI001E4B8A20|nr:MULTISPECIES: LCP family protein [unclassified Arthrobacter]MCC9196195.1 LCP family protein [Arthrobacter sp. zg-Y820]MDK1279055.1 LCP family protein [Arthrobacter sp. zg.Y820]MDK1359329.1 LCP family protein [Arthrobacter sp. zg-Y1219]WIB08535.1 LCP family protein [Arthrobacter sp. zg-Y820]